MDLVPEPSQPGPPPADLPSAQAPLSPQGELVLCVPRCPYHCAALHPPPPSCSPPRPRAGPCFLCHRTEEDPNSEVAPEALRTPPPPPGCLLPLLGFFVSSCHCLPSSVSLLPLTVPPDPNVQSRAFAVSPASRTTPATWVSDVSVSLALVLCCHPGTSDVEALRSSTWEPSERRATTSKHVGGSETAQAATWSRVGGQLVSPRLDDI
ncbi:actin-binding protein WASF1-like [Physeter macrocephalus]|uniref:Actin-binding protein WASF1-like n=1 Tax=Physeter macrocephalus TaxID=9755 RepID=A0A455AUU8_PHYMC|nr:actin-binding protein WASF1-like [Physeter catodon]|eukprot:XP_028339658.1 wiskott-Aldrich syndrome protein family member 1-like [Physeter catodon]